MKEQYGRIKGNSYPKYLILIFSKKIYPKYAKFAIELLTYTIKSIRYKAIKLNTILKIYPQEFLME